MISKNPTYRSWRSMLMRCYRAKHDNFKHYGGKGIIVCEHWRKSFYNFLKDMGQRPSGRTLGRKDGNGNYEPSNCFWATKIEQNRNTTRTRIVTLGGKTGCMSAVLESFGLLDAVHKTRARRGWTLEKMLRNPPRRNRRYL